MLITSKSLHHSNIVFVFGADTIMPDNAELASLFQGKSATGARFVDDPILKTKVLDLPQLKLQVIVEPSRLRIDDLSQGEPEATTLINEALNIYQKLFPQPKLAGFGFNFDIYYRFSEVIRISDIFTSFVEPKVLEKADLKDIGTQFTLVKEGGKKQEQYFIKVVSPLEIAVHINHHFPAQKLPEQTFLQKLFEKCHNETDEVIQNLK